MAAPAFRSVADGGGASIDTVLITKPTGTVDDDILLAQIYTELNGQTVTPPAGWTSIVNIDNASGTFRTAWYYKRASGEGANYTFTATGSDWIGGAIASYSGCIGSGSPIDVNGSGNVGGSNTSAIASAVTTTVADTLIVFGSQNFIGTAATPPSGMTERQDVTGRYFADVAQATGGSTGSKTATLASADFWSAILIALKPPAVADVLMPQIAI